MAEGVTCRQHIDDPALGLKQLYHNVFLGFSNEEVVLTLLDECLSIDGVHDIDPNDIHRMNDIRDCKHIFLIVFMFTLSYGINAH